jgi:hypothetical protein
MRPALTDHRKLDRRGPHVSGILSVKESTSDEAAGVEVAERDDHVAELG